MALVAAEVPVDVKEAVSKAKDYVAAVFDAEQPTNIGLEEIRFDDALNQRLITVRFSRPWDASKPLVTALGRDLDPKRSYKVVHLKDDDGRVVSVTDRRVEPSVPDACSSTRTCFCCSSSGPPPDHASPRIGARASTRSTTSCC